jgi:hypothetical protein
MPNDDLLKLYFQYVADTEPPLQFHRWSLISCVGALLGRNFYLPFGAGKIIPNSYVMLVGNPGTRKSSAIKSAKKLLARAGYSNFSAEKTTKEKFLLDLEGLPEEPYDSRTYSRTRRAETTTAEDVLRNLDLAGDGAVLDRTPREVFIVADEFNEFTGSGNLDFFSLLGSLWDWDDEHSMYSYRLKNSKSLAIYQPTISILGGNTHTSIQSGFPSQADGQGFMSRLLFIHGEPSGRKVTFPKQPSEELADRICKLISEIKTEISGPAKLAPSAERALDAIYRSWREIDDYRFANYSTRRFTHLLKLVMVCAAMRKSCVLDMQDVVLANTLLTHAEHSMPKALGEFGKSRNSDAAQAVMSKLYDSKRPMKFEELWKVVSRDLEKREQLADILSSLQTAGKLQALKDGQGFLPMQKPVASKEALYVDLNLLSEYK